MRLESSAAETRATSSADLRLMITGSLEEATRSQSAASLALASEYVVTVISHHQSCTEILYNINQVLSRRDGSPIQSSLPAEVYDLIGA